MGLRIKLTKSFAGASDTHLRTIAGLGLKRFGQERLLQDTPAIRGMISKVRHLVSHEVVKDNPAKAPRRKPRMVKAREAARERRASTEQRP
ncbi:MAG: 50S ribosomal protein L30 [Myxococcaceae bacterium]